MARVASVIHNVRCDSIKRRLTHWEHQVRAEHARRRPAGLVGISGNYASSLVAGRLVDYLIEAAFARANGIRVASFRIFTAVRAATSATGCVAACLLIHAARKLGAEQSSNTLATVLVRPSVQDLLARRVDAKHLTARSRE